MLGPVLVSFVIYKGRISWPPLLFFFCNLALRTQYLSLYVLDQPNCLAWSTVCSPCGISTHTLAGFLVFYFDKLTTMLVARTLKVMLIGIFGDPKGWETWRSLCYAICLTRLARWWLKKFYSIRRGEKEKKKNWQEAVSFESLLLFSPSLFLVAYSRTRRFTTLHRSLHLYRGRKDKGLMASRPSTFDN